MTTTSYRIMMLYSLIAIALITIYGCISMWLRAHGMDFQFTETYFIIAHVHWLNLLLAMLFLVVVIFLLARSRRRS